MHVHALLQLFHWAVKLDMQNMNAGVEKRWFKGRKSSVNYQIRLTDNDKTVRWITTAVCVYVWVY